MTTQLTEQKTEQEMKTVFVVDSSSFEIFPAQVSRSDWEHESGFFPVMVDGRSRTVRRDGQDRVPPYNAGFETRQQAEEFQNKMREREKNRKR